MSQPAFDLGDLADAPGADTYTVSQLATAINDSLRRRFSDGVWVRGEIHSLNERGPHLYFKLVEHDRRRGRLDRRRAVRAVSQPVAADAERSTG